MSEDIDLDFSWDEWEAPAAEPAPIATAVLERPEGLSPTARPILNKRPEVQEQFRLRPPGDPIAGISAKVQQKTAINVFERSLCIAVSITKPGNSRKVPPGSITVDADKDMIRVSKVLLNSPTLRAITSLDGEIRNWLYRRCLPCTFLKSGVYLLPIDQVEEAEKRLSEFQAKRDGMIEQFIGEYQTLVDNARERLRSTFSPGDYPPVERLRSMFTFEWSYITIGTPAALGSISKSLYERESAKAEAKIAEVTESVQQALRVAMAELVDTMVERLSVDESGKKKVFRNTMLPKLEEFLSTFQSRNLTGDGDLEELITKARSLVSGVEVNDLRTNDDMRTRVRDGFNQIKSRLDEMIVEKPGRAFDFDEE